MAALISGHPVQKSITIHFHPCNPVLLPQNNCSILFCGILLSDLFVYLVAFDNNYYTEEINKIEISMISHDSVPIRGPVIRGTNTYCKAKLPYTCESLHTFLINK